MAGGVKRSLSGVIRGTIAQFRRPEWMVFLPALTLAAFWLAGERGLILTALALPLLFAMAGAFRFDHPAGSGPAMRLHVIDALEAALAQAAETGRTTACLVLQFDDAAAFLSRHGRAAQLEVLDRSGDRLCAALREGDVVARLEGGGFAIALAPVRRADLAGLIQVAARLQAALSEPILVGALRVHVTWSVGFCLPAHAPAQTGPSLLDAAQVAADEALRNGPGAIRAYAPDLARTRADRDLLREHLERALDEGQILPHFQPQLSTATGAITGFEALARWQHPDRGLIPPAEFLPAIADAGLTERLGEVMLYHALTAMAKWDKAGLSVPTVAINVSADELRNPRMADKVKWELDRFGLDPARLCVEILETVAASTENDTVVHNIAALARFGCGIDLDDYGTGNAAIPSIRRFAVRRLKIDRSFVSRLDEDRDQQRMVSAILSMAEQLGLDTLAEGVETTGEHAMLAQLGCGHVQGFGIARPMPFSETADWIARHRSTLNAGLRIGHRAS